MKPNKNVMKTEIHEFPIGIYPRKLWIAVGTDNKFLSDYFGEKIEPFCDSVGAKTLSVIRHKPKRFGGILIWFPNRKAMSLDYIAHEATHFALDVFDYTDCIVSTDNQEPFAYLVGWAARMMDKVKRNNYNED